MSLNHYVLGLHVVGRVWRPTCLYEMVTPGRNLDWTTVRPEEGGGIWADAPAASRARSASILAYARVNNGEREEVNNGKGEQAVSHDHLELLWCTLYNKTQRWQCANYKANLLVCYWTYRQQLVPGWRPSQ